MKIKLQKENKDIDNSQKNQKLFDVNEVFEFAVGEGVEFKNFTNAHHISDTELKSFAVRGRWAVSPTPGGFRMHCLHDDCVICEMYEICNCTSCICRLILINLSTNVFCAFVLK